METKDKNFFIATTDEKNDLMVYESEAYKLSEIEILTLIKICLVERRSTTIGKKILDAYRDSTKHREAVTEAKLKSIGIKQNGKAEPTTIKRSK